MREHFRGRAGLDDLAEIHHQHPVAQQPHHGQIVRDEQIAHAELVLEPLQELQDDDLHGNVERRGRLVEHQKVGLDRDGAGNADAGALAAGKLMRESATAIAAAGRIGPPRSRRARVSALPRSLRSRRSGSAMASKAVKRGLTLSPASWNTI